MRPSDYAELRAFAAVLRHGTFTRAARHLGVSPSALSQTVRHLEERVGRRLLHRTTRSVAPTEAGRALGDRLLPVLDDLEAAAATLATPADAPAGRLRLNLSRVALPLLTPLIAPFLRAHPGVTLDLVVEDALVDIVARGFDAGVRLGERLEGDMVAVPLGPPLRMAVVAAPAYLAAHAPPLHPRDLARYPCAGMRWPTDGSPYRWEFEKDGEEILVAVNGPLICDEPGPRLRFAQDGLGLAYVFEPEATPHLATGHLVRLLADWTPPFPGLHLYTPSRRHMPPPLRAFIDFARARLAPQTRSSAP
jgi:DNA-binding transcriptional LysR family regulator